MEEEKGNHKRFLIVDDTYYNLFLLSKFVIGLYPGCFWVTAKSYVECIEQVKNNNFDFILLDYRLGDGNGCDAANQIREVEKNENRKRSVIILISAYLKSDEYIQNCLMNCDFDLYIEKPIKFEQMEQIFKQYE